MLFGVFRFSKMSFNAQTSSFHDIILNFLYHLGTETYKRMPWQFCNFTSEKRKWTLKLCAKIKEWFVTHDNYYESNWWASLNILNFCFQIRCHRKAGQGLSRAKSLCYLQYCMCSMFCFVIQLLSEPDKQDRWPIDFKVWLS